MAIRINIVECNQSPETCPAVRQIFELDEFYEAVQDIYPQVEPGRQLLGDLVASCFDGTCPGQHPEVAKAALRSLIDLNRDET